MASFLSVPALFNEFNNQAKAIKQNFENCEFSHGVNNIMALANKANQYIDEKKPWILAKKTSQNMHVHNICTMGINLFRILMIYLKPILPQTTIEVEAFLNVKAMQWDDISTPLLSHKINEFKPLITRIESNKIQAIIDNSK